MKKAVFIDMDGTLYSHTGKKAGIPSSSITAIKKAHDNNVLLFGCTGRNVEELELMHVDINLLDGWITLNGGYCFNETQLVHTDPIPDEDIRKLVAYLQEHPFTVMFSIGEKMFVNMYDEKVEEDMKEIHTPYPEIRPLAYLKDKAVYQMCFYGKNETVLPVFDFMHIQGTQWSDIAWDINHTGCSKASGIRSFIEYYKLNREDTFGIGDADNDIPMMEETGTSICMGNGLKHVKEYADYVTSHIDEDGLYNAFAHYGLIGEKE